MKGIVFVAIVLLASFISASPVEYLETELDIEARGIIDNAVNSTLNGIIANLSETITVGSLPLDLGTGDTLSGHLDLDDLKIYGLKSLVATKISINVLSLSISMHLHLTELLVNLKYVADMLLLQLVPLYGDGAMTLTFDEVEIDINGKAKLADGSVSIPELSIGLTLGKAVFDLTGLINSPEFSSIISNILNNNFATFVNENQAVITDVLSPVIKDLINDALSHSNSTVLGIEDLTRLIYEY